uniref:Putative secreted protein n=1 Tax=Ixodes ricinus TaxID=34613 RepID=A0A6B0UAU3_IXORI
MSACFHRSAVALFIGAVTGFLFAVRLVCSATRFIRTVEICTFAKISLQATPGSKFGKLVAVWLRRTQAAHAIECMKHNPRFLLKF